jgi:hypothetical protein
MQQLEKFKESLAEYKRLLDEQTKKLGEELDPVIFEVLDGLPDVMALRWYQYVPYFNDGDECKFTATTLEFLTKQDLLENGYSEEDIENKLMDCIKEIEIEWNYSGFYSSDSPETLKVFNKEFQKLPREILENRFGNDVEVFFTRNGVETRFYDHD